MNLTDLRDEMADRADSIDVPVSMGSLVQQRITSIRRRRTTVGAAGVAAALAAVAIGWVNFGGGATPVVPAMNATARRR